MSVRILVGLFAALIVCALALVTSQHRARKLHMELGNEQALARSLEVEWGQLQLEQGTWSTHARIEKMAAQKLGMQTPPTSRVQIVPLPQGEAGR